MSESVSEQIIVIEVHNYALVRVFPMPDLKTLADTIRWEDGSPSVSRLDINELREYYDDSEIPAEALEIVERDGVVIRYEVGGEVFGIVTGNI